MDWYRRNADVLTLILHVQPGAKRTAIVGRYGDALKIRVASPPIEGRANDALITFLAATFAIPRRQIILRQGENSRRKIIDITGSTVNPDALIFAERHPR